MLTLFFFLLDCFQRRFALQSETLGFRQQRGLPAEKLVQFLRQLLGEQPQGTLGANALCLSEEHFFHCCWRDPLLRHGTNLIVAQTENIVCQFALSRLVQIGAQHICAVCSGSSINAALFGEFGDLHKPPVVVELDPVGTQPKGKK